MRKLNNKKKPILSFRQRSMFLFASFVALTFVAPSLSVAGNKKISAAIPYTLSSLSHVTLNEPLHRILFESSNIGLLNFSASGSTRLGVASQFTIVDGGKSWVFDIPESASFAGGRLLRASNVRDSLEYLQTQSHLASTKIRQWLENVDAIEVASNNLQISIHLKIADLEFANAIASFPIVNMEVRRGFADVYGKGTQFSYLGAFEVIENRVDEGIVLGSVPRLYELKTHQNARIEFRYFDSSDRVLRKLIYGLVDIVPLPTSKQILEASKDPRLQVLPSPFANLSKDGESFEPLKTYWGEEIEENRITTEFIIVRDSFALTDAALKRFDLSNVSVVGKVRRP